MEYNLEEVIREKIEQNKKIKITTKGKKSAEILEGVIRRILSKKTNEI